MGLHARLALVILRPLAVEDSETLAPKATDNHEVDESLRGGRVDLHIVAMRLWRLPELKFLRRSVVEEVGERPLVGALPAKLAVLHERDERVLGIGLACRLVLAVHLIIEENNVPAAHAKHGDRRAVVRLREGYTLPHVDACRLRA